ncbi:probable serine/threonine-protein kinase WNK7 [Chenopodium quinoa]|uniref:probable serine/threonine-protein kinase WNK7 n=1 Tax=Chenopodium quinoa TaxID=63459 RepID=UPI000B797095|nr:probable serine/threonine-protein kinase WNK7 [Chenopodium quinoa]
MAASSSRGGRGDDYTIMETDPSGQYSRYNNVIEESTSKVVFKGYDRLNGKEVAWIKKTVTESSFRALVAECDMLCKSNSHYLLKVFKHWIDLQDGVAVLHMITEYYSNNLGEYCKIHKILGEHKETCIARWCKQILLGLQFLHEQDPVIVHSDINLNDIAISGTSSTVKIADLTSAKSFLKSDSDLDHVKEAQYSELRSLGLCVLLMIRVSQKYADPDRALDAIKPPKLKGFVDMCLHSKELKASLGNLLSKGLMQSVTIPVPGVRAHVLRLPAPPPTDDPTKEVLIGKRVGNELSVTLRSIDDVEFLFTLGTDTLPEMDRLRGELIGMSEENIRWMVQGVEQVMSEFNDVLIEPIANVHHDSDTSEEIIRRYADIFNLDDQEALAREIEKVIDDDKGNKKFGLKGKVKDRKMIHMDFIDYDHKRNKFDFSLETYTILQVMEMIKEKFGWSAENAASICQSMEQLITEFVPMKILTMTVHSYNL